MMLMFVENDVTLFFDVSEELFKERISDILQIEHFIIERKSLRLIFLQIERHQRLVDEDVPVRAHR